MRAGLKNFWRAFLGVVALLVAALPAAAHPHVFITTRSELVYGAEGKLISVRHVWTFDEGFSAYLSQGLDKDKDGKLSREELSELAKENVESLTDSSYFTVAKAAGKGIEVAPPTDYFMESDGKFLTLTFILPLRAPVSARLVSFEVYDPNFFIQFTLADGDDAIKLKDAPKGCTLSIRRPKPIESNAGQTMSESFFGSQSAAADYAAQFTSRAIAACP